MEVKLTIKQQRFVDFFDGNATEAARKAGYKNPRLQGHRLITNDNIKKLVQNREKKENEPHILTRQERQSFWTSVINGEITEQAIIGKGDNRRVVDISPKLTDRLKASELLGRSQADFTDNIKHKGSIGFGIDGMSDKELDNEIENLASQ